MKIKILAGVISLCIFAAGSFGTPLVEIRYATNNIGAGQWEYTYTIKNIDLPAGVEEFTIWFDFGKYDNLAVTTPDPPASDWDEIIVQPEPVLKDDGFYDALTLNSGIVIGQTVSDFSVSFDWLGIGSPGSQFYEIIDPVIFETIDSGWTVPEPATVCFLILGTVALCHKKQHVHKARFFSAINQMIDSDVKKGAKR